MGIQVVVPDEAAGLDWEGQWNDSTNYVTSDVVERLGSSYRARRASTGEDPALVPDAWDLVAQKGDKGDEGDPGEQGLPGIAGSIERTFALSSVWVWDHGLNSHPTVVTTDDDGGAIYGDVTYPNYDTVRVDFGTLSFSGKMTLG